MKTISYAQLQKKHAGEYIARRDNRIVACAKTYSELIRKLAQRHIDRTELVLGFVPPQKTICIYA